jgi:hypothetical protein
MVESGDGECRVAVKMELEVELEMVNESGWRKWTEEVVY